MQQFLAKSIFPKLLVNKFFKDADYNATILDLIKLGVGGFVLFEGDINQVYKLTNILQNESNGNLIFAADCEDGVTMRFQGGTEFPNMWALAETNDPTVTYSVAKSIALEMKAIGLHWNLAPVVDVNINPNNPIINTRAFGEVIENVLLHSEAFIKATQDFGIIACAKHFPGHGDTDVDSHSNLPILNFDLYRLQNTELPPFVSSITKGVLSIMTAHLCVPCIDNSGLPASLSNLISTDFLQNRLGFNGVVITDALDMHAITKLYSNQEAALLAYTAGADVLETMPNPNEAMIGLMNGLRNNLISEERIYGTYEKINNLKKWLLDFDIKNKETVFSLDNNYQVATIAATKALKIQGEKVDIKEDSFLVAFANKQNSNKAAEWINCMFEKCPESYGAILNEDINEDDLQTLAEGIEENESIIIGLFVKPSAFSGSVGLSEKQELILKLALRKEPIIMNFGNPYLLKDYKAKLRIDAFSFSNASIDAACKALSNN